MSFVVVEGVNGVDVFEIAEKFDSRMEWVNEDSAC
jgi:hypothetical protein